MNPGRKWKTIVFLCDTIYKNIYKLYNPRSWILYDIYRSSEAFQIPSARRAHWPAPSIPWHFPPYTPSPILSVENCWKVEWDQISQIVALAPNSTPFFWVGSAQFCPPVKYIKYNKGFWSQNGPFLPNQSFMELSTGSNGSKGSTNGNKSRTNHIWGSS